ncbi:hypothetical protein N9046_07340 [Akkermansiaceae bacterium]|nr:hypothetical protein [Akkermansiaceae bacterium]
MNSFKNVIAVLGLRRFSPILQRTQVAGGLLKNKKHKALKTRNINPLFGWRSARALAKALFTVVLSLNLCSVTLAQEDFGDPVIYANNTATVYGVVTINGQPAELGDVVGFFVGSELRFKGPVVVSGGKAYVTGLMNAAGGNEVFTFKVYDDSAKAVYPVPDISLTVGPGSTTGPTPLFEIKASSGPGLEEQLAQMTAARDAAIAERDARPTQAALAAAVVESRAAGQGDVTTDPAKYNLVTQASYDTVVAERDARPTQATLDAAVVESRAAGQGDVTTDPAK